MFNTCTFKTSMTSVCYMLDHHKMMQCFRLILLILLYEDHICLFARKRHVYINKFFVLGRGDKITLAVYHGQSRCVAICQNYGLR